MTEARMLKITDDHDPDDFEFWTEAKLEARLCSSMYAGEAIGFEGASGLALKKAQDLFAVGKDSEANMFRDFSRELKTWNEKARTKQQEVRDED